MKVKKSEAIKLLSALNVKGMDKSTPAAKMGEKLNKLHLTKEGKDGSIVKLIKDKMLANILKAIIQALKGGKSVVVEEEKAVVAAKNGKPAAKGKKVVDKEEEDDEDTEEEESDDDEEAEEEVEEEEVEDTEDSDDEDEEETEEEESEDEEETEEEESEDDEEEEDSKPSKKNGNKVKKGSKVKVKSKSGKGESKPARTRGDKDAWGSLKGTATSKLNHIFSREPKTVKELEEEAGRGAIGGQLRMLRDSGLIEKDPKSGGYRLKKGVLPCGKTKSTVELVRN